MTTDKQIIANQNNSLKSTEAKTTEEVRDIILQSGTGFDAKYILGNVEEELNTLKNKKEVAPDTFLYKSMTLFEFDKGVLLLNAIPELHRVFALEFSKSLQTEYNCKTPSEKSMAEVVSLNFVRVLETQRKIKDALGNMKTRYDIQYLAVLSKELDRAERHYLNSLQALRTLHSPSFEVNIKTNTAVLGQNQVVQVKNA